MAAAMEQGTKGTGVASKAREGKTVHGGRTSLGEALLRAGRFQPAALHEVLAPGRKG